MSLDCLHPPAARFAAQLFTEHPEWRAYAEAIPEFPGEFAVVVPNPVRPDFPLRLSTGTGCVFCVLGDALCWMA